MAVKVIAHDLTEKVYTKAVKIERDGHGDWVYLDLQGNIVATRNHQEVKENEVL